MRDRWGHGLLVFTFFVLSLYGVDSILIYEK